MKANRAPTNSELATIRYARDASQHLSAWECSFIDQLHKYGGEHLLKLTLTDKQADTVKAIADRLGEVKRYYLVSYYGESGKKTARGNLQVTMQGYPAFPGSKFLKGELCKLTGFDADSVTILNIYEFKSEIEYEAFSRG